MSDEIIELTCVCSGEYGGCNIRSQPSIFSDVVGKVSDGEIINVYTTCDSKYWLKYQDIEPIGYISTGMKNSIGSIQWKKQGRAIDYNIPLAND